MADIRHEIVDDCAVFTAVSARGKAWLGAHHHESHVRFALRTATERVEAERLLRRAKSDGLALEPHIINRTTTATGVTLEAVSDTAKRWMENQYGGVRLEDLLVLEADEICKKAVDWGLEVRIAHEPGEDAKQENPADT